MERQFMTGQEVADALGVSISTGYKIIRKLNEQLGEMGYVTIPGKVSRQYFLEKCCYGGKEAGA